MKAAARNDFVCGRGLSGSCLDAAEHLAGHDEVGRDDRQQVGGSDPPWPGAPAAAEDEPGPSAAEVIKDERPRPVDPGAEALLPARRQVFCGTQNEVMVRVGPLAAGRFRAGAVILGSGRRSKRRR
jgi:hypothetical protein